jgi:hypothetical protein
LPAEEGTAVIVKGEGEAGFFPGGHAGNVLGGGDVSSDFIHGVQTAICSLPRVAVCSPP